MRRLCVEAACFPTRWLSWTKSSGPTTRRADVGCEVDTEFPASCCRAPDDFPLRRLEASTNAQPEGERGCRMAFRKVLCAASCLRLIDAYPGWLDWQAGDGDWESPGRGPWSRVERGERDSGHGLRTWAPDMGYGHGTWNTLTLCFVSQVPRTYYWTAPSHPLEAPSSRWIWRGFCSLPP